MMRDATLLAPSGHPGRRDRPTGSRLALAVAVASMVALLIASIGLVGAVRQTVMLFDPNVRQAEARAQVAEADKAQAQATHDAAGIRHDQQLAQSWDPVQAGVTHVVGLGLLTLIPLLLLLACGLLVRRHLSLPTRDGRVPLVGLDRELSREALIRYQLRELAGVTTYQAFPEREDAPILEESHEA